MPYFDDEPKSKKKETTKDIALDKMEIALDEGAGKKKKDKIKGRPKNVFVRFAVAAFPQSDDSVGEKLRKAFLLMAVAVLIGTLLFLVWQILAVSSAREINSSINDIAGLPVSSSSSSYSQPSHIANPSVDVATTSTGTKEPEVIDLTPVVNEPIYPNFDSLRETNPDTRAWVKITGTLIDNVVVQSDDNEYYLTHNFFKEESVSGTIFSSYRNRWDGTDDNIVLFGHNMWSGEFFAYVMHYFPDDESTEPIAFYKVHPTIMLATPDGGCETYKIFAGVIANTQEKYGEVFHYVNKTRFTDVNDFNDFIIDVMDRSWFFTDVNLTYGDKLLTLSTCHWPLGKQVDTRWVLFARKVRPGESEYVDTSVAYRNYQAKLFDYYYELIEGYWAGSVWDRSKLLSY